MKTSVASGLLAALVLSGLGWCVMQKNSVTQVTPVATSTPIVASTTAQIDMTPVVLRARVSTEGWKTCRNIGAGYEFLYPADWVVYSAGSYWTNPFDYPPNTDCTGFKSDILARRILVPEDLKKEQLPIVRFDINHVPPKEKKTIDELFATSPSSSQERIIKEVYVIDGVKAFLYQLVTKGITFAPSWENVGTIMFMSPDQVVSIEITGPSVTIPTLDPILETILSTFHFLKK